jgi:hypothetical protein
VAGASCRLPERATATPAGAAAYLFDSTDALGFAMVERRLDGRARQPERIRMVFSLKGPEQTVTLHSPFEGGRMIVSNYQTSFEAAEGSIVFAALRRAQFGWVISECTAQLLNRFPLGVVVPELRREFLRRAD